MATGKDNGSLPSDEPGAEIDGAFSPKDGVSNSDIAADAGGKSGAISGAAGVGSAPGGLRSRARVIIFPKPFTPARMIFALFTLSSLWYSADRPEHAVWTLTVIASSYLALQTIALTASIPGRTVLVSVSYLALLASAAAHLSSAVCIFIMLLNTAYAAGRFGYALYDHRQRKGSERSAEDIPRRSDDELKHDRDAFNVLWFYASVVSLASAVGEALALYCIVNIYWLVVVLVLLIDLSLFCWMALVAFNMTHAVLLTGHEMSLIYWGCLFLMVPDYFLSLLFGQGIGVLVHLSGLIFLAGFLGYNLGIYHHYKRKMDGDKKVLQYVSGNQVHVIPNLTCV